MHRTLALLSVVMIAACGDKPPPETGPPIGKHVDPAGSPLPGAYEACSGKSAGITCTIGYKVGTCGMPPPSVSDPRLACLTEGGPGSPPSAK